MAAASDVGMNREPTESDLVHTRGEPSLALSHLGQELCTRGLAFLTVALQLLTQLRTECAGLALELSGYLLVA